jgi:regulator of replication initiation timing
MRVIAAVAVAVVSVLASVAAFGEGPTTATRPAATSPAAEVAELRRENAALRAEIAELRKQLSGTATTGAKPKVEVTATNWREHLKVGMTEAAANAVFDAIPKAKHETFRKRVIAVDATGQTVTWTATASGQRTVVNNQVVGLPPKSVRLCTIFYEDGRIVEIRF